MHVRVFVAGEIHGVGIEGSDRCHEIARRSAASRLARAQLETGQAGELRDETAADPIQLHTRIRDIVGGRAPIEAVETTRSGPQQASLLQLRALAVTPASPAYVGGTVSGPLPVVKVAATEYVLVMQDSDPQGTLGMRVRT